MLAGIYWVMVDPLGRGRLAVSVVSVVSGLCVVIALTGEGVSNGKREKKEALQIGCYHCWDNFNGGL